MHRRRERERAQRERLIVTAARELAEAESWHAVTTRRLAAEIEYSRPKTFWAALHGLATLMRSGRLPENGHEKRLTLLIGHFAGG
ncbi:hypothetical protein [Streptomyces sp. NPDC007205]|uniref:hypothetical protein n=1 Tax=Streptomyces sp. NPDC007205 TaxID=3154316 RepID=UPI0033D50B4F